MTLKQLCFYKIKKNIILLIQITKNFFLYKNWFYLDPIYLLDQIKIVGPDSIPVVLITAFFVGMVFSLQIIKEFLYLNAVNLVGTILSIAFIRELSPVLTSVIVIGRIASSFAAELGAMKVTEQIDALYLLEANPFTYLVMPRIIACIIILPLLNLLSFSTSLFSSSFICFAIYSVNPVLFFMTALSSLSFADIRNSCLKSIIFAFIISSLSCLYGLSASGGARGVGNAVTSSVVSALLSVFILDFILSYFMFSDVNSVFYSI
uniref:ABC transporter permease n=1 Tax=Spyridia filamentosa TaxID=196632 RepID=A0A1Z1MK54_SPYFI|nr:hypothetical protein [Spyridia filamentosa]ARW66134.1 hypothetical protein [Spyridia filamentosa]